jgi:CheY-like chemotaxis protein
MSGYELARRIRSESDPSDILLIAITGWGQTGDRAKAAASGFDHHLTKPLDYSALAELLRPQATRVRLEEIGSVIRALDA